MSFMECLKQTRAIENNHVTDGETCIMYNTSILSATSIVGAQITTSAGASRELGHCSQCKPGGCASVSSCDGDPRHHGTPGDATVAPYSLDTPVPC